MKAYIFTEYKSDRRDIVLIKKVIVSDLPRFEIMKLEKNGIYDWEECDVEFRPERLNPEEVVKDTKDYEELKEILESNPIKFHNLCDSPTPDNR